MQPTTNIIDDKYEILSAIGAGGMGLVYKAYQHQLDRLVAIKMLNVRFVEDESRLRFEREAVTLNNLKHRNIINFYGYGVHEDAPYLVTEYLEGRSLEARVRSDGPLSLVDCLRICQQICEALHCAHANDVVHRDLKPSNIMLNESLQETQVKLIDFGLVKLMPVGGKEAQQLTDVGQTVGSVLFMSTEQCLAEPTDQRSDIYSLGCLMHYCLTGNPPFYAEQSVMVMMEHVNSPPPTLSSVCPMTAFPEAVQRIISKAMEKKPADRYQTVRAMSLDIIALLADLSTGSIPNVAAIAQSANATTGSASSSSNQTALAKNKRGHTASIIAIVFGIIVTGTIAGFWRYGMPAADHTDNYSQTSAQLFHMANSEKSLSLSPARKEAVLQMFTRAVELNKKDHLLGPSDQLIALESVGRLEYDKKREDRFLSYLDQALSLHEKYRLPFNEDGLSLLGAAPAALLDTGAPHRREWANRLRATVRSINHDKKVKGTLEMVTAPLIGLYLSLSDKTTAHEISQLLGPDAVAPLSLYHRARLALAEGDPDRALVITRSLLSYTTRGDWMIYGHILISQVEVAFLHIPEAERLHRDWLTLNHYQSDTTMEAMYGVLNHTYNKQYELAEADFKTMLPNLKAGNYTAIGMDVYLPAYEKLLLAAGREQQAREVHALIEQITTTASKL
jgi:serine/threonine protein kinase